MTIDFTKIRFAGEDMIMITVREKAREPILLLNKRDILKLNIEWDSSASNQDYDNENKLSTENLSASAEKGRNKI